MLLLLPGQGPSSKNVVRDFIYGCWCNGRRIGGMQMPPLNHLYVATVLKISGYNVTFLDAQVDYSSFQVLAERRFRDFGILIIMSSTNSFREDVAAAEYVKALNPDLKVVFFGSHPTFMPENCLSRPAIDYIIIREPELALRDLVDALSGQGDPRHVAGCGYRDQESLIINPPRDFFDMDELPIPDWTLLPKNLDYFNPVVKRMPYATMQTSRGCPAKCIFCTAPVFYGRKLRVKSTTKVMEEIRYLLGLGYREIFFRDETFTAYRERNHEICQAIIDEGLDVTWIANGRVDMIDRQSMEIMKRAGCHMLKFGVESGSDIMLKNYRKGTTTSQTREVFRMAHQVGIDLHAHLVLGGPGESAETIRQTIEFVKEIDPTTASFGILTPYPGTEFFRQVTEKYPELQDGTECNMEKLHTTAFFSSAVNDIAPEQLQRLLITAYRSFYWRPSYILKWLGRINSFDEFLRLLVAGSNIFQFSLTSKK